MRAKKHSILSEKTQLSKTSVKVKDVRKLEQLAQVKVLIGLVVNTAVG